jgi:AraC-like DNA-binding protein
MLEYENDSIEQIAEACGFCDRNYFSTVFRKKLGIPPAEFRKMLRMG